MGQKVHPYGFRLGFNKPWRSRWFAKQGYAKLLQEDLELKEALTGRLKSAGVSAIGVDRPGNQRAWPYPHLAPRHYYRPQRRRDRKAQAGYGEEDQARGLHRHSGSTQAGVGRAV